MATSSSAAELCPLQAFTGHPVWWRCCAHILGVIPEGSLRLQALAWSGILPDLSALCKSMLFRYFPPWMYAQRPAYYVTGDYGAFSVGSSTRRMHTHMDQLHVHAFQEVLHARAFHTQLSSPTYLSHWGPQCTSILCCVIRSLLKTTVRVSYAVAIPSIQLILW